MSEENHLELLEQCRALEKEIAERKGKVVSLAKKMSWGDLSLCRPQRYSVDVEFVPPTTTLVNDAVATRTSHLEFLQPATEPFVVDAGTHFRCATIESSMRFTGNAQVFLTPGVPVSAEGQAMTISLGYGNASRGVGGGNFRNDLFEFDWSIRDTGSDRDWQNFPQPEVFLCSGRLNPTRLPVFGRIKGGSEVEVTINPVINTAGSGIFFTEAIPPGQPTEEVSSMKKIIVQISFHGYERIL